MNKMLFILVIIPILSRGQQMTTNFESGLSWTQILAKAKTENKSVFMDCYATWCAPCQYMDKQVFPKTVTAEYLNKKFICVKVQMDKTPNDAQAIQNWYAQAETLKTTYEISSYPTYLMFSPEGKPLSKITGSSETGDEFISKLATAFDSGGQYFTLLSNWEQGQHDSAFLYKSIFASERAGDYKNAKQMAGLYVDILEGPADLRDIILLDQLIESESDKSFSWFLRNAVRIDSLAADKSYAEKKMGEIIFNEEIAPLMMDRNQPFQWITNSRKLLSKYPVFNPTLFTKALDEKFQKSVRGELNDSVSGKNMNLENWKSISIYFKRRFPGYDCNQIVLSRELTYYRSRNMWPECARVGILLLDKYGSRLDDEYVNEICWYYIFLRSGDRSMLLKALSHMEIVVNKAPGDTDDLDTYANLLYKLGHKQFAIDWEKKAISISIKRNEDSHDFEQTLDKMQKNLPTWLDNTLVPAS